MLQKSRLTFSTVSKTTWGQVTIILAILLLALILRLAGLGAESAWIDEAYSINLANHNIVQIIQGTAADQHPPLYYLLLHFWFLAGSGVAYARLLSVVIGIVQIYQVMDLARLIGIKEMGWLAGLILAISPMHVWYSQEARMYMLLASLTTASTTMLWTSLHGKRHWWLYTFFSIAALYTHYFAVFIMLAQAVLVIAWVWQRKTLRPLYSWICSGIIIVLSFIPWVPVAINQTRYHKMTWILPPNLLDVVSTSLRLLLGNDILALPGIIRYGLVCAAILLLVITLILVFSRPIQDRLAFVWIILWALIPFGAITIISIFYPIFQFKQFIIVLSPLLLLSIVIIYLLPKHWLRVVLFTGLLISNVASLAYQQFTLSKDDWRGAAAYIQSNYQDGDFVFGNPAASKLGLGLYWQKAIPFDGYPTHYDIVTGGWDQPQLTASLAGQILQRDTIGIKRFWLVEFTPQFLDPNKVLESWLSQHAQPVDDRYFGQIRIRLYQLQK
jgi:uncharacterized membrane protein